MARSGGLTLAELAAIAVSTGAAIAACFVLEDLLPVGSLALVFVCAVLVAAVRTRLLVALATAGLCSLAYVYFFTEPRYSFRIGHPGDVAAVVTFALAALFVGHLASRKRAQGSELAGARLEAETERLRSALLASVSHDLRSPLAAVIGAASSLSAYGETLPEADRRALVEAIGSESERLDRYIQNLLDMTRLGAGGMKIERDWIALDEIVAAALARLRKVAPALEVRLELEPGLPLLFVHPALLEQALFNVLENAAKVSPPGAPLVVRARREGGQLVLDVVDRGPGIPEAERRRIFDPFVSIGRGDRAPVGSGLGLTIVRGMVGAHGGRVVALDGDPPESGGPGVGAGTTLRITLPVVEPSGTAPEEAA